MFPNVSLHTVAPDNHSVIERLWEFYCHDLSEFRGTPLQPDGTFGVGRLPLFFDSPDRRAYLARDEKERPIGFVLIRGLTQEDRMVIGEFFVVRSVRRQGVGHQVALSMFERHPGRWAIPFQEENAGAAKFWRRVATAVAGNDWEEEARPVPGRPDLTPDIWILLDAKG
ncbi:GNAT family N-acetyltransferase [Flindersiella endophytica]